jgi:hypothetical protein
MTGNFRPEPRSGSTTKPRVAAAHPGDRETPEINPETVAQRQWPIRITHPNALLIPNISLIDLDTVFPTYPAEFILEGFPLVTLLLIGDVLLERINMGRADRKRTVACLPMKILKVGRLGRVIHCPGTQDEPRMKHGSNTD